MVVVVLVGERDVVTSQVDCDIAIDLEVDLFVGTDGDVDGLLEVLGLC